MENLVTIELAKKVFTQQINFKLSYKLTKFRNKLTYGIDFSEAEKPIVEEILKMREKAMNNEPILKGDISPETIKYLNKMSNDKKDIFNYDELIELGSILTGIEDKQELEELYDIEVREIGYDELIGKLTLALSTVFTSAKDISETTGKTTKKKAKNVEVAKI